ncbi:hypothetical protein GH741_15005 [Aquibacillus halophilus]|uniref:Tetratricopeptide repeat protein n=1 Tax=Aquibacillus halophilus TaxID=930132 RepID=A0A6A8DFE5_9BACI|nr:AimR family lysis-lysogeny pheromone receptor [Aquibacillus halophilus]MRH43950.1 hypothetical protein [Aquibacillus halophilus]
MNAYISKLNMQKDSHSDINNYMSLDQFVTMFKLSSNERTMIEQTKEFCLQSKVSTVRRTGMEFLYMNGCYGDLKELIVKNKQSLNSIDRKWGQVYELLLASKENSLPLHDIVEQIHNINTNIPELKCLLYLVRIDLDYLSNKFNSLGYYLDDINDLISEIENPLLSSLYKTRLNGLLFMYYWKRNELILARKHAYRAINDTLSFERKARVHLNLGLTFIFEDFYASINHLQESLKIAEKFNMNHIVNSIKQRNYPFVCAHFGHVTNVLTDDLSEKAHIEIAKGNVKGAQTILQTLPSTPFRKYYLGLATNSEELLRDAYNEFINTRSDYFFAKLPLIALNK